MQITPSQFTRGKLCKASPTAYQHQVPQVTELVTIHKHTDLHTETLALKQPSDS